MTGPRWITTCGRICYRTRKINVSQVFAGQKVDVKQVGEHIWLVSFMHYDLGYFNDENLQTRTLFVDRGPKRSMTSLNWRREGEDRRDLRMPQRTVRT